MHFFSKSEIENVLNFPGFSFFQGDPGASGPPGFPGPRGQPGLGGAQGMQGAKGAGVSRPLCNELRYTFQWTKGNRMT